MFIYGENYTHNPFEALSDIIVCSDIVNNIYDIPSVVCTFSRSSLHQNKTILLILFTSSLYSIYGGCFC